MTKLYLCIIASLFLSLAIGQNNQETLSISEEQSPVWVEMMRDPNANFYDVQEAFYSYWNGRTIQKGKGYKTFKRWENYMQPRVYPTGDMTQVSQTYENYSNWAKTATINFEKSISGNWQALGPVGKPSNGGAGRVNFLRFDPSNSSIMYVGTPDGGLWKSIDGGTTWSSNTDQLAVIGCSDLAIDPNNSQIMYLATGDNDAGDTYSVGVLKSTDGGATWNTTGLNWTASQGRLIGRLLIDPSNSNTLIAATSIGVQRSINGGTTWTSVTGGNYNDMEFKPGDPTTVYVCGTQLKKSTNNGATWTTISSGLPTISIERISMAVTPANAAYVYLLYGQSTDQGLLGVYRSTDSGANFTEMADNSPNYLGWESNASDAGGQAFYDLTIAASPTNANEILIGGVNLWRSTNGGTSWTIKAHWTGSGAPEVHADHHDLVYLPGSGTTFFSCNDGGIFKTTNSGTSYTDISSNLTIAQQYRIGSSASTQTLILSGHQDNGTNRLSGSTWSSIFGGDGMDCFIDRTNNSIMISSYVYGEHYKSTNGGSSFSSISSSLPQGSWLSVIHQDPVTATTYYAGGRSSLYKTTNSGSTWTTLGTPSGSNEIIEFAIAPSNNQVIYSIKQNAVSKSTNGGTSWTNISSGLPTSTVSPTNVAVSNTNANVVYVTFSGYSAANKVYKSTDGGTTWTGISTGLPNVPCNTIVYHNSSAANAVYVGTDVGVYYKDDNLASWTMFSTNLPRVSVRDLEIFYPTGRIRAATYGRGTWDSDLYSAATTPTAGFSGTPTSVCAGQTVTFTNTSTGGATSYAWSFPGGTPATSSATNPTVTYSTGGSYNVQLIATNAFGSDTLDQLNYINVTTGQNLPLSEGFVSTTFPPTNWNLTDVFANGTWARTTDAGNVPTATSSVVFDNFNIDDRGSDDELQTLGLNFSNLVSANLAFDVAYAPYDAVNFDSLEVLISTDCGSTFTRVYLKSNTTLATAASTTASFTPASNQWRTESINLTAYVGASNAIIAFRNHAGYGNRLFLDNINITGVLGTTPTASFTASTTTICAGQTVTYTNTSSNNPSGYTWTFQGGTPSTSTATNPTVTYSAGGNFDVQLVASNNFGSNTATQSGMITVNALPSTPGTISGSAGICANSTNVTYSITAVANASSYNWTVPAGASIVSGQGSTSIVVNFGSTSGNITVNGINGCGSGSSQTLAITLTSVSTPTISASGATSFCSGGSVILTSSAASGNTWSTGATSPSITVNSSGNYTVTVTSGSCSASSTTTSVTVNPNPVITFGTVSNPSSCGASDGSLLINGSGTGTLSWSGNSSGTLNSVSLPQTISALSAGDFTVTFNTGCPSNTLNNTLSNPGAPATPSITSSGSTTICAGSTVTLTSSSSINNTWSTGESTQSIVVSTAGTYSVIVTNATCFANSADVVVSVTPLPTTPTITANGSSAICAGSSVVLSSSSATGNTWSNGQTSQAITVNSAGTFTVTVTNSGCTSAASNAITVTVNPLPTVTMSSIPAVCNTAAAITLNQGSPVGGSYSGNGVSGTTFNPATANIGANQITYTFTNGNGCTNTAQTTVTVNNCAAIDEAITNGFRIYPNPSFDYLIVEGDKLIDFKTIELIDEQGKIVAIWKINNATEMKLDVSNVSGGNYLLKISKPDVEILQKIQIVK